MLFWLGVWVAKATCQSLCKVKKNNKHLLIPVLAAVTHTTDHGKSNMATWVQIVLGSTTTCNRATNGLSVRVGPKHWWWTLKESHGILVSPDVTLAEGLSRISLQNLPWEQRLTLSLITTYKFETAADTNHFPCCLHSTHKGSFMVSC